MRCPSREWCRNCLPPNLSSCCEQTYSTAVPDGRGWWHPVVSTFLNHQTHPDTSSPGRRSGPKSLLGISNYRQRAYFPHPDWNQNRTCWARKMLRSLPSRHRKPESKWSDHLSSRQNVLQGASIQSGGCRHAGTVTGGDHHGIQTVGPHSRHNDTWRCNGLIKHEHKREPSESSRAQEKRHSGGALGDEYRGSTCEKLQFFKLCKLKRNFNNYSIERNR